MFTHERKNPNANKTVFLPIPSSLIKRQNFLQMRLKMKHHFEWQKLDSISTSELGSFFFLERRTSWIIRWYINMFSFQICIDTANVFEGINDMVKNRLPEKKNNYCNNHNDLTTF